MLDHAAPDDLTTITSALARDGAVIVDELLADDVVARLNAEIDPAVDESGTDRPYMNELVAAFYAGTRNITGLPGLSPTFVADVLCHPTYAAVAEAMLGPNCAAVVLNVAQVLERGPGAEAQFPHRDDDVWIHLPQPHPEVELASVIALDDFTPETGATRLVPGSHQWDRDRQPDDDEFVTADMSVGSGVIYMGGIIHGGGTNTTDDRWRRGMHLSYVVGWLRTEENHVLATPPAQAAALPSRAQALLGYAAHDAIADAGGYLGAVDLQDPMKLLAEGRLG